MPVKQHSRIRGIHRLTVTLGAALGLFVGFAAPASAADQQQQVADYISAGTAKPVVAETIRSGASTWNVPRGNGPRQSSFTAAFTAGLADPNQAPAGANDWSCKPTGGKNPVVLVHGTWEDAYTNFSMISPALKAAGYCVYALNYGILSTAAGGGAGALLPGSYGTGEVTASAKQIAAFVDAVRTATGAAKVNMVGHSLGGTVSRQYIRYDGGAAKVANLVTLGATNNGTTVAGIGSLGRAVNNLGVDILGPSSVLVGPSSVQQIAGSAFLKNLNKGGQYAIGNVRYTVVGSRYDEVTTPYNSTFFPAGTRNTRNIVLQNGCEADTSDHFSMSYSPRVVSIVLNAFDARHKIVCAPNAWLVG